MSHRMDPEEGRVCLLEVARILDDFVVPFFLIQGTALGAWRDRGFTPRERDIDLGIRQECLTPRAAWSLLTTLTQKGYDLEVFTQPLGVIHTLVAWKGTVKLDLVGFSRWKQWRYSPQPVRPWTEDYALVHEATLLEETTTVELFGRIFAIPRPIEVYLEREYGPDWRTPREDHVSRTRVQGFLRREGLHA